MARSGQGSEQAVACRVCGCRRPRRLAKLAADVGDVPVNRVLAEDETCGDLRVAKPLGDETEDLQLAPGQHSGLVAADAQSQERLLRRPLVPLLAREPSEFEPGARHLERLTRAL